jgi:hypothetical protein
MPKSRSPESCSRAQKTDASARLAPRIAHTKSRRALFFVKAGASKVLARRFELPWKEVARAISRKDPLLLTKDPNSFCNCALDYLSLRTPDQTIAFNHADETALYRIRKKPVGIRCLARIHPPLKSQIVR